MSNGKNSKRILFKRTDESYSKRVSENDDGDEIAEDRKEIEKIYLTKEAKEKCKSELKNSKI